MEADRLPCGTMFAITMLTATHAGGTFALHELREDLERAGFRQEFHCHRGKAAQPGQLAATAQRRFDF